MNMTKLSSGRVFAALLAAGMAFGAEALTVTKVSQATRPSGYSFTYGAEQISGITYAGGNLFYAIDDTDNKLYPIRLNINRSTGELAQADITIEAGVVMSGGNDMEGCAFDPCSGRVWISQETGALIREFDPSTGTLTRSAPVPAVQKNYNGNYSLEALTISGDGKTMWTANEEALKVDGLLATNSVGSVVRLTRFTRDSVHDNWTANGEWAYETQPIGTAKDSHTRSGVSGLCALPDGTLLVLERRCYQGGFFPDFNIKIYQVNFSGATDVSSFSSLKNATYTKTNKAQLFTFTDTSDMPNYEGICLGPRLNDGSCVIVLITDGGSSAAPEVMTLKLSGLDVRTMDFNAPENSAYTASVVGTNYRYVNGAQVSVDLQGDGVAAVAYTNNGATVASAEWTVKDSNNQPLASGVGTTAAFSVTGDGTLTWAVATSAAVSPIIANDSFEAYAAGTSGSEISGWSGEDAEVVTTNYSLAAGYPMAREVHTKVLSVDGDVTRTYPEVVTNDYQKLDMAIAVRRAPSGRAPTIPDGDNKLAVVCDENGYICLVCKLADGGTNGWVRLSDKSYENDEWVRVEIMMDYASNGGGRAFAQVKVDGEDCATASGYVSPTDLTAGGSWYELLAVGSKRCISALRASGLCKLDDVILTIEPRSVDPEFIDGVPVSWLDEVGLGRDPGLKLPAATYPALAAKGYTLGDVFASGIDLAKDEPFDLVDIQIVDVDGREGKFIRLTFNGVRRDKPLSDVYQVIYKATLDGAETLVSGTAVAGDGQTVWTSDAPVNTDSGFYYVKAIP